MYNKIDRHWLQSTSDFYRHKLLDECIPFWIPRSIDKEYGGYLTAFDQDGSILDTDKSIWQQGRFCWLLGELYNEPLFSEATQRTDWLNLAIHGADFLLNKGLDTSDQRLWFQVDRSGNPIRKRRYRFSESFAAIAFGELAKATADPQYECLAIQFAHSFCNEPVQTDNPKFTQTRPSKSIGIPMIRIGLAQQLRDSIDWDEANSVIHSSIDEIESDFVKPEMQCVMEQVAVDGGVLDHFDGRTLNPGHAIEAAWFILQEADFQRSDRYRSLGCRMLEWMFARGWDQEYGGLLYFVDVFGKPVQEYWHDMKFWWPHNETVIASLYAYLLTGDEKYQNIFQQVHDWAFTHFDDPQFGEWFGYLHRDGSRSVSIKGNLWKGPFHYPRMLLYGVRLLDRMLLESK